MPPGPTNYHVNIDLNTVYTVNKTKKGHCVNWERLEQSNTRVFTETKISLKIFVRQSFIYREKNNYG